MATIKTIVVDERPIEKAPAPWQNVGECGVCHRPIIAADLDDVSKFKGVPRHDTCLFPEEGKMVFS